MRNTLNKTSLDKGTLQGQGRPLHLCTSQVLFQVWLGAMSSAGQPQNPMKPWVSKSNDLAIGTYPEKANLNLAENRYKGGCFPTLWSLAGEKNSNLCCTSR